MKSSINFEEIAASALARCESLLTAWLPGGRVVGGEFKAGSLRGDQGDSLGVNIGTGRWQDFATGEKGGDLISLLAAIKGITQLQAAQEIEPSAVPQVKSKPDAWAPLPVAPDGAPFPDTKHFKHGASSGVWRYATKENKTIGFICRYNTPKGKEFAPISWCKSETGEAWRSKAFADPRPLYGLETLNGHTHAYVTEGEKAADALRRLFPGEAVLSWPGGASAVSKADWEPLRGLSVTVWPDNDGPGMSAAQAIQKQLPQAYIARPPSDVPDKWDAADAESEGWSDFSFLAKPVSRPPDHSDRIADLPFRMLGVSEGVFFYIPDMGQEIVELSASSHTKFNLMRLAPLQSWEMEFPSKAGSDWDAAVNCLIQKSQRLPKFDPRRVRGRGCWIDGNDVVFHAGGHLLANGTAIGIPEYRSSERAIYEGSLEIQTHGGRPAINTEAAKLITLCESLAWERPLYGKLLAGWLALAPICGALGWRPHLWITGPSGSGKSWVVSNVIAPMVGKTALSVQGNTSEAGIRGMLGCDALPVVFDEAESEDAAGMMRLSKILELARQASSETGAGIIKGTAQGGSITYMVRSMFLFASIGVAATKKADTSRITLLSLRKNSGAAQFETVKAAWVESTKLPEFGSRIRARSLSNAINIRANAEIFSTEAVDFTGDKRSADQIGTLLAGAFSLTSSKTITADAAQKWMQGQDWTDYHTEPEDNDESQCLSHLLGTNVAWDRSERVSVDDLVDMTRRESGGAAEALLRFGMRFSDGRLWVANKHPELERIFKDTPWSGAKWKHQLARIPESRREPVSRFGFSLTARSVSVPL